MNHNVLITGGAGFIGSHTLRLFVNKYPTYNIYNLDNLSNSANLNNLNDIKNHDNYNFILGDICDFEFVNEIFDKYKITRIIHLAAESHVDLSIEDPIKFAKTNVMGTLNLLLAAKNAWKNDYLGKLFYHISTDEVYGSLDKKGFFTEKSKYEPHSPYSASKAASDHFVRSFSDTYGLPVIISNCSNNYGPCQFTDKLIPLFINNILKNKNLPVYGNGENIRDWLYVEDHVNAIDTIFHYSALNETYNIGGYNEWKNIDLINLLIKIVDEELGRKVGASKKLITYVNDRKGHDFRYAIDASKIKKNLGWKPTLQFEEGLKKTVKWYLNKEY